MKTLAMQAELQEYQLLQDCPRSGISAHDAY